MSAKHSKRTTTFFSCSCCFGSAKIRFVHLLPNFLSKIFICTLVCTKYYPAPLRLACPGNACYTTYNNLQEQQPLYKIRLHKIKNGKTLPSCIQGLSLCALESRYVYRLTYFVKLRCKNKVVKGKIYSIAKSISRKYFF